MHLMVLKQSYTEKKDTFCVKMEEAGGFTKPSEYFWVEFSI